MKNKNKTISLRLNEEEYNTINTNSNNLNMTNSQYLRSLINAATPSPQCHYQEIAGIICRLYIRLGELGLEDEEIAKEVHNLCQTLS